MSWTRCIRFLAKETQKIHLGQPRTSDDIALALEKGTQVSALEISGDIFDGKVTDKVLTVEKLLSPLETTGAIRCTGLNYVDHANEAKMPIPKTPVLFFKVSLECLPSLSGILTIVRLDQHSMDLESYRYRNYVKTNRAIMRQNWHSSCRKTPRT